MSNSVKRADGFCNLYAELDPDYLDNLRPLSEEEIANINALFLFKEEESNKL